MPALPSATARRPMLSLFVTILMGALLWSVPFLRSALEAAPAEPTPAAAEPVEPVKAVEVVEPVEAAEATKATEAGVFSPIERGGEIACSDAEAVPPGLGLSRPGRHADAGEGGEDREREDESFGL